MTFLSFCLTALLPDLKGSALDTTCLLGPFKNVIKYLILSQYTYKQIGVWL